MRGSVSSTMREAAYIISIAKSKARTNAFTLPIRALRVRRTVNPRLQMWCSAPLPGSKPHPTARYAHVRETRYAVFSRTQATAASKSRKTETSVGTSSVMVSYMRAKPKPASLSTTSAV